MTLVETNLVRSMARLADLGERIEAMHRLHDVYASPAWDMWALAEMRVEAANWERAQTWRAVWMLLTTRRGDYEIAPWPHRLWAKARCLLAILLCRRIDLRRYPEAGYRSADMGHWDLSADGRWWTYLEFHAASLAYRIMTDGEDDGW